MDDNQWKKIVKTANDKVLYRRKLGIQAPKPLPLKVIRELEQEENERKRIENEKREKIQKETNQRIENARRK